MKMLSVTAGYLFFFLESIGLKDLTSMNVMNSMNNISIIHISNREGEQSLLSIQVLSPSYYKHRIFGTFNMRVL